MEDSQFSESTMTTLSLRDSVYQTPAKAKVPSNCPKYKQIEDTATFPSKLYLEAKAREGGLRLRDLNQLSNKENIFEL
ncbi:hypothetical protein pb186bvf_010237 [Paramecium bursaria]